MPPKKGIPWIPTDGPRLAAKIEEVQKKLETNERHIRETTAKIDNSQQELEQLRLASGLSNLSLASPATSASFNAPTAAQSRVQTKLDKGQGTLKQYNAERERLVRSLTGEQKKWNVWERKRKEMEKEGQGKQMETAEGSNDKDKTQNGSTSTTLQRTKPEQIPSFVPRQTRAPTKCFGAEGRNKIQCAFVPAVEVPWLLKARLNDAILDNPMRTRSPEPLQDRRRILQKPPRRTRAEWVQWQARRDAKKLVGPPKCPGSPVIIWVRD